MRTATAICLQHFFPERLPARRLIATMSAGLLAGALFVGTAAPASALSELKKPAGQTGQAATSADNKPVDVIYDIDKAPEAARQMRTRIIEAATSGDIERLRTLLTGGKEKTQVTVGETSDDPIKTLKELSGDSEGVEILAILLDIVSTGFVHTGQGTADEMYVWPYFAEKSLTSLTPPEKVELLRIVTAGDFSDMLEFGGYNFYRVGITPDGQWKFFVAGD